MQYIPAMVFFPRTRILRNRSIDAGMIFIGPPPHAIEIMGSKLAAKAAVAKFNVPLVPGTSEPITDIAAAKKVAASTSVILFS